MSSSNLLDEVLAKYGQPDKVKIQDVENVAKLINEIKTGGPSSLQVIVDFDFTLTRRHLNGETCHSSHGILDNSPLMPASYRERGIASVKKYYPIEIDPNMTVEEKIPLMIEWYNETHADLVSTGVSRNDLVKIIKADRHVHLRDNAKETLQILNELNIPTLIFSAGIGNLIEGVLKLNEIFYPNLHIISNFVIFGNDASKADEGDQVIVGFQEPMVHMFNKDERTVPKDSTYFIDLAHRNNAILLGDTLTDVNMSNGLHQPNAILKIGFLNDKIEERLDLFMKAFDVVLLDDQSMDFMNAVLKAVL